MNDKEISKAILKISKVLKESTEKINELAIDARDTLTICSKTHKFGLDLYFCLKQSDYYSIESALEEIKELTSE